MIVSEILMGSIGLTTGPALALSALAAVGIRCASSISFFSSIATLFTKENFSKIKIRYTKLRDWINVITLLYDKTLKQSIVDKKINEKEAQELKKTYNHYPDKRKKIIKNYSIQG